MDFSGPDVGYLTLADLDDSHAGRVLATRNGGRTSSPAHVGSTLPLETVYATPSGKAFAAGRNGTVVEIPGPSSGIGIRNAPRSFAGSRTDRKPAFRLIGGGLVTERGWNSVGKPVSP